MQFLEKSNAATKLMIGPVLSLAEYLVFDRKWSPFHIPFFLPFSYIVDKVFGNSYNLSENEHKLFMKLLNASWDYGNQGWSLLGHFLIWGDHSRLPTGVHFNKIMTKYNCVVLFGDDDWMKIEPVRELIERLPENHKCEGIHIVKGAGHALSLQNAQTSNEQIFKFYELFKNKNAQNLS